ncbi:DUF4339 domain-containing protein [Gimesia chilikensis]|uniref:GYF domain-containing protein n=1 Tax=Gimesia chilikensis TaxID=2605989 RepID=A0A517PSR8_9PLAN|nr:DUF4339 domain-containing protein [Gimesia chilikensis]QDT22415.1 hypothetical protein HG66A1_42230 [Gimesia chilikensis]
MEFQEVDSKWWLANSDQHEGPFSVEEILARVAQSDLRNDQLACPVGGSEWKPLREWDAFAEKIDDSELIPPPPPLPSQKPGKAPWNPTHLWYLGLLFSPLWLGILTAINSKRLGLKISIWGPLGLGIGWLVADIFFDQFVVSSLIVSVLLLGGFAFACWYIFLEKQLNQFESNTASNQSPGSWLVPCLAGSPLALLQLAGIAVAFLPTGPRDVCSEFLAADTPDEAKQYVTSNMMPIIRQFELLETLAKQLPELQEDEDEIEYFQLTDEAEAAPNVGGYLVGYQSTMPDENGGTFTLDGYFHLLEVKGEWKIDSWIITQFNNQPLDNGPTSMLTFFKGITDELQRQIDQKTSIEKGKSPLKRDYSFYNYGITPTDNSPPSTPVKQEDSQRNPAPKDAKKKTETKRNNLPALIVSFLQSIFGETGGRIVFILIIIGVLSYNWRNSRS